MKLQGFLSILFHIQADICLLCSGSNFCAKKSQFSIFSKGQLLEKSRIRDAQTANVLATPFHGHGRQKGRAGDLPWILKFLAKYGWF